MPRAKKKPPIVRGRLRLTDDFVKDEPLAFLVKNFDQTFEEYRVFGDATDAKRHAETQYENRRDACPAEFHDECECGKEWPVYPLYAGDPIDERLSRRKRPAARLSTFRGPSTAGLSRPAPDLTDMESFARGSLLVSKGTGRRSAGRVLRQALAGLFRS